MVERQLHHVAAWPEPHSKRDVLQQRSATERRDSAFGRVQRQRKLMRQAGVHEKIELRKSEAMRRSGRMSQDLNFGNADPIAKH